jgi:hypothetical protein
MNEWKPIETATRHNSAPDILVGWRNRAGEWVMVTASFVGDEAYGRWRTDHKSARQDGETTTQYPNGRITHWHPLPEPPL